MDQEAMRQAVLRLIDDSKITGEPLRRRLENARDPAYWEQLNPGLTVSGRETAAVVESRPLTALDLKDSSHRMARSGYFITPPVIAPEAIAQMRGCIDTLRAHDWPAVFTYVYDIFWQVFRTPSLNALLRNFLGDGYAQNALIWTYFVASTAGARGWPPHTDSKRPGRATVWMPISHATLDNGCMYVVPRDRMPANFDFSGESIGIADAGRLLQSTKALPSAPGAFMGWSHDVMHWGSMSEGNGEPRISIAVEFVAKDAKLRINEGPLFPPDALPSFEDRLAAIATGIREYKRFEPGAVRFEDLAIELSPAYRTRPE